MMSQFKDSLEDVLMEKVEDGLVETREMVDQLYQMITGNQNQTSGQGQGQGYGRFGNNNRGFQNRGRGGQGFQRRNGNQGRGNYFGNNFRDQQCSFCKRWRHSIANCQLLLAELRKRGCRIAKNGGFGNGGNFSQNRNNGGFGRGNGGNQGQFGNNGQG